MSYIKVAAVQMDVTPGPVNDRLQRAGMLVSEAAQAGAQLVVLPEVFNTGYAYSKANYDNAETVDGQTLIWMKNQASSLDIHLAGTILLRENRDRKQEIKNALFLFAPDGKSWRYDKNYPWSWEYAYSVAAENRPKTVVAHTDLGDIGFLICWDVAHGQLWRQYAGQVDLMVISSSPPDACNASLVFAGEEISMDRMGPIMRRMRDEGHNVFRTTVSQQLAWLGVPGICAMPCGTFESQLPCGVGTLLAYATYAPWLLKYLWKTRHMALKCPMVPACQVVEANGQAIVRADSGAGECFVLSDLTLPQKKNIPQKKQPQPVVRASSFFLSDYYIPLLTRSLYKHAMK